MHVRVAALFAIVLAGCAARPTSAPEAGAAPQATAGAAAPAEPFDAERQLAFDEHDALVRLDADVDALASTQDCGSACAGGARLCDLSERVCAIAERLPSDAEVGARCADGRERCERARARLAEAKLEAVRRVTVH